MHDHMDEPPSDHGTSDQNRRKGPRKRVAGAVEPSVSTTLVASTAPCGACKFLRRKCINGCVFAPYFGSDQGAARFAAVHKVFGASNVSKLLLHIPANRRQDAVVTITYEAQARLSDPVYGCVSAILALQQQVASLQSELALVQTQLMNSRYAVATVFQTSQQQHRQQPQEQHVAILQPSYSNNSSVSNNNLINNINSVSNFNNSFAFDHQLHGSDTCTANNSPSFDPIHQLHDEDDEEEEESHNPLAFTNHMFH